MQNACFDECFSFCLATDCLVNSVLLGLTSCLSDFLLSRKDCRLLDRLADLSLDQLLDWSLDPFVRLETLETDALDFTGGETTQGTAAEVRATGGDWALIRFESLTTLFISALSFDSSGVIFQAITV